MSNIEIELKKNQDQLQQKYDESLQRGFTMESEVTELKK